MITWGTFDFFLWDVFPKDYTVEPELAFGLKSLKRTLEKAQFEQSRQSSDLTQFVQLRSL